MNPSTSPYFLSSRKRQAPAPSPTSSASKLRTDVASSNDGGAPFGSKQGNIKASNGIPTSISTRNTLSAASGAGSDVSAFASHDTIGKLSANIERSYSLDSHSETYDGSHSGHSRVRNMLRGIELRGSANSDARFGLMAGNRAAARSMMTSTSASAVPMAALSSMASPPMPNTTCSSMFLPPPPPSSPLSASSPAFHRMHPTRSSAGVYHDSGSDDGRSDQSSCFSSLHPLSSVSRLEDVTFSSSKKNFSSMVEADGENLLVGDLKQLSLEERNEALDDIHGVAKQPTEPEDPEFLRSKLDQLAEKMGNIRDKRAYERAVFLFPRYMKDDNLKLTFLRPYNYDVTAAAKQMVEYFQCKLELFGPSKLGKELTLDDLSPEDLRAYNRGIVQFFTRDVRDRSGRTIFYYMFNLQPEDSGIHELRAIFYAISSGWRSLTVSDQKQGSVAVIYFVGATPPSLEFVFKATGVARSLSTKVAACHICYNTPQLRPAVSLLTASLAQAARVRCRSHFGSHLECMYALRGYGIDDSVFPLDPNNELDQEKFQALAHKQRMFEHEMQQQIEANITSPTLRGSARSSTNTPILMNAINPPMQDAVVPTDNDVLLGRGRPFQVHPGNLYLASLIERHREAHSKVSKTEKTQITRQMVKIIQQERKGRFLKLSDDGLDWQLVTDDAARSKVSHGFRTKPRKSMREPLL